MLDEEELDKGLRGDETFLLGFWLPSNIESENLALKVLSGEGDILEEICLNPRPHAINPFPPLRLDKLGLNLRKRFERLSQDYALDEGTRFKVTPVEYLKGHEIVYLKPAEDWVDGLPLGNGGLGGIVTGRQGVTQTLWLDKTDLWLKSARNAPLGRFYAGKISINYNLKDRGGQFKQRLSHGMGKISTEDSKELCRYESTGRIHALKNVAQI